MIIFTDKGENHFILSLLILFYYYYYFFFFFFTFPCRSFSLIFHVTAISHRQGTAQYLTAAAWNQAWKRMTHFQNT